ncbi:MAG TPA: hypothetical protein VHQ95_25820 [Pyrinomonadaceae bacterium]|nr:hypothetical protein [Pyrinomonadaceae bacterium]
MFARLTNHPAPSGLPQYGYLLENGDTPVGVILLIFVNARTAGGRTTRGNVSSWYVEPAFRSYAALLVSCALKHKDVSYLNVTAAPSTRAIADAQGYHMYSRGLFVATPALSLRSFEAETRLVNTQPPPDGHFEPWEQDLLFEHAKYGCISLWCETSERAYPFVFRARWIRGIIPYVQLVYCRDIKDLARLAGPIGRFLLLRGHLFVGIDSNGSIADLVGKYFDGKMPKYFKGRDCPRLGDLAYTEIAMFGV